ncbi:YggS family pyridoxal phosphate-dependent enzyme [Peptococcus simiae]|uniref:YggS family pyridoxal phosphate-dependent enzyme n=1 Tax=Peptococcus simiae TaxID=1643805 RepID=UPI00397F662E
MSIKENISLIRERIEVARKKSPHPEKPVDIIAVSKFHDVSEIREAMAAGATVFGENRVQELIPKLDAFEGEGVPFHVIGHLQTNKVRQIVGRVAMIQSLDSLRLAQEIEKRAAAKEVIVPVLVQVNVAGEDQKYGLAPEEVKDFLEQFGDFPHLKCEGLMFIAPNLDNKDDLRPYFRDLYKMFLAYKNLGIPNVSMTHLSMGMSGDYEVAVEEGATMVRIGSAIFAKK